MNFKELGVPSALEVLNKMADNCKELKPAMLKIAERIKELYANKQMSVDVAIEGKDNDVLQYCLINILKCLGYTSYITYTDNDKDNTFVISISWMDVNIGVSCYE